jgi:hypothetical protein
MGWGAGGGETSIYRQMFEKIKNTICIPFGKVFIFGVFYPVISSLSTIEDVRSS